MKNRILVIAVGTFIVLAGAIWSVIFFATPKELERTQGNSTSAQKEDNDNKTYENLKGDAFDEAYIADMIAHHEGAVNMAEQAQAVTEREEIRVLAGDITQSQSMEMMQMRAWQDEWGYEITNSGAHMGHGEAGSGDDVDTEMLGDMVEMQNKLQGLRGAAYDEEFLKQMILHHEQAIDMSRFAPSNAKHEELRELAASVVDAQLAEIKQMEQWQKDWRYE